MKNTKYLFLVVLFLVAFLERTVFDLGPNVELVTAVMILASFYLGKKEAFWLTFVILVITDSIIGNSNIFLFTWSGFLIPALFSTRLIKILTLKLRLKLFPLASVGLSSNIFFFFWTNFGVWLLDSWGMYTKDLQGLVHCYINALPFLRYQVISTLIFVPVGFALTEMGMVINKKFQFEKRIINLLNRAGIYRI